MAANRLASAPSSAGLGETGAADRVRTAFEQQGLARHLGVELLSVGHGTCEIAAPWRPELTQQDGLFHGGLIATIADNAAGFAALSLMPAGARVLSVELKINFLAPSHGERAIARGSVLKAGRTLTVTRADVFVERDGREHLVAALQATMIAVLPAEKSSTGAVA